MPLNGSSLPEGLTVHRSSDDSAIFKVQGAAADRLGSVYSSAIKSCGYDPKQSLKGATRQLLVGLKELKIEEQKQVELGGALPWFVRARASSEGMPVLIASYSARKDDCIIDFVVWAPAAGGGGTDSAPAFGEFLSAYEQYIGEELRRILG